MGIVKACLGLLVFVAVVVSMFQVVPPIMSNYSFNDDLKTVALMDGANPAKTDEDIRADVLKKAKDHELPLEGKQITVTRLNSPGIASVYVVANYAVTINLPGYTFDLHFNPDSGNKVGF
jgi:hypothetical protein